MAPLPAGWLAERIRPDFGEGGQWPTADWTLDPWFLKDPFIQTLDHAGYPRDRCLRAAEGLKKLYPANICRRLLFSETYFHDLFFLFQAYFPSPILYLLDVGLSFEQAWPKSRHWIDRLRLEEGFQAAALEVEVLADLMRYGFRPELEPKVGDRRADLLVLSHHRPYVIEIKDSGATDVQRTEHLVEQSLGFTPTDLMGKSAEFRAAEAWRGLSRDPRGRQKLEREAEKIGALIQGLIRRLASEGALVGTHAVETYGELVVRAIDDPKWAELHCDLVPPMTEEEKSERIVDQIVSKTAQVPVGSPTRFVRGVIVIDVGFAAQFPEIDRRLRERVDREPLRMRGCDLVVLRSVYRESDANFRMRKLGRLVPLFQRPDKVDMALAKALAGGTLG